jgi:predicted transcriptional regulator
MVRQYVETQAWQVEGIKEAISSMDRGEGIDHEAVMSEMDALLAHQGGPT